jgi:GNAT superfamily N-acetyltransferase
MELEEPTGPEIIATACYGTQDEWVEVAFAVDDKVQGQGLGGILLKCLAEIALQQGITLFWAVTHADNYPMLQVFRKSGYPIDMHSLGSIVVVEIQIGPSGEGATSESTRAVLETLGARAE